MLGLRPKPTIFTTLKGVFTLSQDRWKDGHTQTDRQTDRWTADGQTDVKPIVPFCVNMSWGIITHHIVQLEITDFFCKDNVLKLQ